MPAGSRSAGVACAAGAWTACAAWLTCGTIAFAGSTGPRFGVLPADWWHGGVAGAAGLLVLAIGWRAPARTALAVSPLALTVLPWLPISVPPAFLIWTGALASIPWLATAFALVAVVFTARIPRARGSALAAGLVSLAVFAVCAWRTSPSLPMGDEPHYLVLTQSLLSDNDLQIENNHRRGDYRAYFRGELLPHYVRRGRNGAIYSMHAPGLPALVLPAFAIGGYPAVVVFLLLISASACALAWWLAWRVTGDVPSAWFGWAAVALSAPFLLDSFTVLPDGPGAAIVLVGFWTLLTAGWESEAYERGEAENGTWRWLLYGIAFAALPWLHTRFAVIAATLGGLALVRLAHVPNAMSKAVAFLSVPAVSALGWLFFFVIVYGAPDPTAPFGDTQNSFAALGDGLGGLLFDQGFGLLATAPALVFAFAGFAWTKRLALEWGVVAAPYLLAVGTYPIWWAGTSSPARFLVPLLLPLAIPAAHAWKTASRGARAAMLTLLIVSGWCACVMVSAGGGRLAFHARNDSGPTQAPWMEWANPVVDLAAASPAYVPLAGGPAPVARANAATAGLLATLPWLLCIGGAIWFTVWFVDRRIGTPEAAIAVSTIAFAVGAMIAATIVWAARGVSPVTIVAAQMQALRASTGPRTFTVALTTPPRLDAIDVRSLPVEVPIRRAGRGGFRAPNRPLATFPRPPAGSYELQVRRHGAADGWIMAGAGTDQFSIVTKPMVEADGGIRVDLPVDLPALAIRAEEAGRDQLDAIVLRPISLAPQDGSRGAAQRAVRYGGTDAFFMNDWSYPEPGGFWVAGGHDATVVIAPDRPEGAITLLVRNGAAPNVVTLDSGDWRVQLTLGSGEERRVDVPLGPSQTSALVRIRSAATFRPSDVDPASRDTRLLGVFVRP